METIEEWRPVVGYEGLYEVSNLARIKSLDKKGSRGIKIVKSYLNPGKPYMTLQFRKDDKLYTPTLHTVVADAFCEKPQTDKRLCVDHVDGNKLNNNASNLEWVTFSENIKRAIALGLTTFKSGHLSHMSKVSLDQARDIIIMYNSNIKVKEICVKHNISKSCAWHIIKKTRWENVELPDVAFKTKYYKNLSDETIQLIKDLLAKNTSKLQIQNITGVCRKSVIYKHL